jgi:hypothetical protein
MPNWYARAPTAVVRLIGGFRKGEVAARIGRRQPPVQRPTLGPERTRRNAGETRAEVATEPAGTPANPGVSSVPSVVLRGGWVYGLEVLGQAVEDQV